jgi:hypothetical protein
LGVTAASSMTMPADFPPALAAWAAKSSTWGRKLGDGGDVVQKCEKATHLNR